MFDYLVNAGGGRSLNLIFTEAQHGPALGLQIVVLAGVFLFGLCALVPIATISLYGKRLIWKGEINSPATKGILKLWLKGAAFKFIEKKLLKRGRAGKCLVAFTGTESFGIGKAR